MMRYRVAGVALFALATGSTALALFPGTATAAGSAILRPDGDVVRQWTGTPGTAWAAIDDDVTEPAAVVHADYIYGSVSGRVTEVTVSDPELAGGSARADAWFYANTGGETTLRVDIVTAGIVVTTTSVAPGSGYAWRSVPIPALDRSRLADLRLRFTVQDGGDSNVRAAYVRLGAAIPPQPTPPLPPSQAQRDRELAMAWAPFLLQDTSARDPDADYISKVDFDGDWVTTNNWQNQEQTALLTGAAYYSVVETTTHWFIVYGFYHPRDWERGYPLKIKRLLQHENDMEGTLFIVRRNGAPHGVLDAAVTVAHHDFYAYTPPGSSLRSGRLKLDGVLKPGPVRAWIAQEAETHAMHAWRPLGGGKLFRGGDGVVYRPTESGSVPRSGNDRLATYELIDIFAPRGLWQHRHCRDTFNEAGAFQGDVYEDDKAQPPWRWRDNNNGLPAGVLANDPVRILQSFTTTTPVSTTYVRNPYRAPAPATC